MRRMLSLCKVGREDLRTLWFALHHRSRPIRLLSATGLRALFALEPANFATPKFGAVDDLVLLPILQHALARMTFRGISRALSVRMTCSRLVL